MPLLLQPRLFDDPEQHFFDDVTTNDLFQTAMEEIERMNVRSGHLDVVKVSWMPSIVGPLLLGAHEHAIRFVHYADPHQIMKHLLRLQQELNRPLHTGEHRLLDQLETELEEYFAGTRKSFTVPLKPVGTAFQHRVWQGLQKIPYGSTWSYEQLATEIGQPSAHRAVGLANGANPIAIVIPCHRVINKNGQLGGYGGGLWRKERLLKLESPRVPVKG